MLPVKLVGTTSSPSTPSTSALTPTSSTETPGPSRMNSECQRSCLAFVQSFITSSDIITESWFAPFQHAAIFEKGWKTSCYGFSCTHQHHELMEVGWKHNIHLRCQMTWHPGAHIWLDRLANHCGNTTQGFHNAQMPTASVFSELGEKLRAPAYRKTVKSWLKQGNYVCPVHFLCA